MAEYTRRWPVWHQEPVEDTYADAAFFEGVEVALDKLLGKDTPAIDEVGVWTPASGGLVYQKIGTNQLADGAVTNLKIAAAAGIPYSKLSLAGSVKLNADIDTTTALAIARLAGYPADGTQVLKGDGTWGAVSSSGVLGRQTTTQDIANSVAETSVIGAASVGSFTVAAGVLSTFKMLRLHVVGDFLKNNVAGDTLTLRVKFGGVTLYAGSILAATVGTARHPWHLSVWIGNLGAANAQTMTGQFGPVENATAAAPTTGIGNPVGGSAVGQGEIGGSSTVDTTVAQAIDVTAQWSAASVNNSFRARYAVLELV